MVPDREPVKALGYVSQKSRKVSGLFRVPQFPLYHFATPGSQPSNLAILLAFLTLKTC